MEKKPGAAAIVIVPAWDSCGSHEVFKGQIRTLQILGLETYLLAVPGARFERAAYNALCRQYRERTCEIACDARGEMRLPFSESKIREFEAAAAGRSTAYRMTEVAEVTALPYSLKPFLYGKQELFILCNHYFNVPVVQKLQNAVRRKLKFVLETHDIQSRHYREREPPMSDAGFDAMLADEMEFVAKADRLIHINREEHGFFAAALPGKEHQLVYPAIQEHQPVTAPRCKTTFLIVSAPNAPNAQSIEWFLTQIWSRYGGQGTLRIVGGIDRLMAQLYPDSYARWQPVFAGRVENLEAEYEAAAVVVMPAIAGEGISIKFAEAMAHGKTALFTPHAVRGLPEGVIAQMRPGLCEDADALLGKLCEVPAQAQVTQDRAASRVYRQLFAQENHVAAYYEIVQATANKLAA